MRLRPLPCSLNSIERRSRPRGALEERVERQLVTVRSRTRRRLAGRGIRFIPRPAWGATSPSPQLKRRLDPGRFASFGRRLPGRHLFERPVPGACGATPGEHRAKLPKAGVHRSRAVYPGQAGPRRRRPGREGRPRRRIRAGGTDRFLECAIMGDTAGLAHVELAVRGKHLSALPRSPRRRQHQGAAGGVPRYCGFSSGSAGWAPR
jgi:hypothetical protein